MSCGLEPLYFFVLQSCSHSILPFYLICIFTCVVLQSINYPLDHQGLSLPFGKSLAGQETYFDKGCAQDGALRYLHA